METLRQRLAEQKGRHQGGSKWIGTGGTSPFGAYGYNPEGIRIGQDKSRHGRAIKVWDKREFKDLDGEVELGTRNIKVALRRLRKFARDRRARRARSRRHDQGDRAQGLSRHPAAARTAQCDQGAAVLRRRRLDGLAHQGGRGVVLGRAQTEFKHMEHFYFHNCLYEKRVEGQPPPLPRSGRRPGTCCNTYRARLQGRLRRRRLDEPLRDRHAGRLGGALNPGAGRAVARTGVRNLAAHGLDQPDPRAALAVFAFNPIIADIFQRRMFALTPDGVEAAMKALAA